MHVNEQPLMILRVEDKFGVVHIVKYYNRDNPVTVAHEFGLTHGLDQNNIDRLVQDIQASLNRLDGGKPTRGSKKAQSQQSNYIRELPSSKPAYQPTKPAADSLYRSYASKNESSTQKPQRLIQLDTDPINLGEKNYIVGKRQLEREIKKAINKVAISDKTIATQQELRFKPDILRKSQTIAHRLLQGPFPKSSKPEDRLLTNGKAIEEKIAKKKLDHGLVYHISLDHEAEIQADCTFKPQLNPKTHEITRSRGRSSGMKGNHINLYNEAVVREEYLQKHAQDFYEKVCPFNPTLSKQPEDIRSKINAADYRARGEQWLKRRAEQEKEKHKIERKNPEIGKDKQSKRPPNVKIHEYLYASVDKKAQELQSLRKTQELELANSKHKNEAAEKLIWEKMDVQSAILKR